jgi:hypothetical protein
VEKFIIPIGTWHEDAQMKEVGKYFREDWLQGARAFSLKMIGALGWSVADVDRLVLDVKDQVRDDNWESWQDLYVDIRAPLSCLKTSKLTNLAGACTGGSQMMAKRYGVSPKSALLSWF